MPPVVPYIPQEITVHLGPPGSDAANVTVPFVDYVKNVASSEIYPTWDEAALRANILAIISFALNRVYTEFYRSRGYDFDITNSTAYDQAFVNGRSYFDNVSQIVDELITSYLRRPGFVEPLAAKFCNGTTVTCEGLSQWGSQNLAMQGYSYDQILRSYYGDVEVVSNAPVRGITSSYPGTPLRVGSTGPDVVAIQVALNRIAQNYPAIPRIPAADGIFGSQTEASVRRFQEIFSLNPDGIVGPATWNAITRLYTGVNALSELQSQGQQFYFIDWAPPEALQEGSTGEKVRLLQYMLSTLAAYIPNIPEVAIDGIYGPATRASVLAAQRWFGLPETGTVDEQIWNDIYDQYSGIENTTLPAGENYPGRNANPAVPSAVAAGNFRYGRPARRTAASPAPLPASSGATAMTQFPGNDLHLGSRDPIQQSGSTMRLNGSFIGQPVRSLQTMLRAVGQTNHRLPIIIPDGIYGPGTMSAVSTFQMLYSLPVTGVTDQKTWERLVAVYLPAMTQIGLVTPIEIILAPEQVFREGESSPYLYLAQGMLTALAQEYSNLKLPSMNGTTDSATMAAVAAFQQFAGLPATGELDRPTWAQLANQFTLYANRNSRY